jgi:hypothetical protein
MLRSLRDLLGYEVEATDGRVGKIADLFFGDLIWTVHYLVVDTGGWLRGRQVLLAPVEFGDPSGRYRRITTRRTRDEIEKSPPIEADKPVSRQQEADLASYFNWLPCSGLPVGPVAVRETGVATSQEQDVEPAGDAHLRSVQEVAGYRVDASNDSQVGTVEDFVAETDGWIIRYLVAAVRREISDVRVLISPAWINCVEWGERRVALDLPPEKIRDSPRYDPSEPVNREVELQLYDYHGRPHHGE